MHTHGRNSRWRRADAGRNFLGSSLNLLFFVVAVLLACLTTGTLAAASPDESRPKSGDLVRDLNQVPKLIPNSEIDHYEKGLEALAQGRSRSAIRHFEAATRRAPKFGAAHMHLGMVYQTSGLLDEAEREYQLARSLEGDYRMPTVNLASVYLMRGQNRKAVRILREATAMTPPPPVAFYNLGLALFRLDQLAGAEQALLRALELDPTLSPQASPMLAQIYLSMGDLQRLMELLDSYLATNPTGEDREWAERLRSQILNVLSNSPSPGPRNK